jgi:hypothetical protein
MDLADAARPEVAWRGLGVKENGPMANIEKRDKHINGTVKKTMQNLPPRQKA